MAKKDNRKCIICGKSYHYCPNCSNVAMPSWYAIFCGDMCHDIYTVCTEYRDKKISLEDAYNKLAKYDFKEVKEELPEDTKTQVEEILAFKGKTDKVVNAPKVEPKEVNKPTDKKINK